jgi:hypothetical protein
MGYIDWDRLDSDNKSYKFEDHSGSEKSLIIWLGDSPPKLQLNAIDDKEKASKI